MSLHFEDHVFAKETCTVALIFIMFYGGFGTRWDSAKPVVREATLLASLGVILTAGLTGLFCRFALRWGWGDSFLLGSVVISTDAASVFSILRSKKWDGKRVMDIGLPKNVLLALVLRKGERHIPRGDTILQAGDKVIIVTKTFEDTKTYLVEKTVKKGGKRDGHTIGELSGESLVLLIRRNGEDIIPSGETHLDIPSPWPRSSLSSHRCQHSYPSTSQSADL